MKTVKIKKVLMTSENKIKGLTPEQVEEVKKEMVKDGIPVRFLYNGQNVNLITGELQPKGTNVLYQIAYWNFKKETIQKIVKWLGVKAVF